MSRTTSTSPTPTESVASSGPARRFPRWVVPFAAAAAGVLVWYLGVVLGAGPVVASGQQVSVGSVVVAGLVAGFLGWGVRALIGALARRRTHGGRTGEVAWLVTCAVVLLFSLLAGPLGAAGAAAVGVLVAEHVVVGVVIAVGLRR